MRALPADGDRLPRGRHRVRRARRARARCTRSPRPRCRPSPSPPGVTPARCERRGGERGAAAVEVPAFAVARSVIGHGVVGTGERAVRDVELVRPRHRVAPASATCRPRSTVTVCRSAAAASVTSKMNSAVAESPCFTVPTWSPDADTSVQPSGATGVSTTSSFAFVPVLRKVAVTVVCSPWNTRSASSTATDAAAASASWPPTPLVAASMTRRARRRRSRPTLDRSRRRRRASAS